MLSEGITACPRCAQDISPSLPRLTWEEQWELQQEVRWCFSAWFTVLSDQCVSGMELTEMCLSIPGSLRESVWWCFKWLWQNRFGVRLSLTSLRTLDVTICRQFDSGDSSQFDKNTITWVFYLSVVVIASDCSRCYFIWSENEQIGRFNPQLPRTGTS